MRDESLELTTARGFDNAHFLHPWEDLTTVGHNNRTFAEYGEGIYLHDENGRRLIDGPGGMWCVQIGHGRSEMAQAIADQAARMAYYSPWNLTASPATRLAHEIAKRTPGDLNHVFFTTGGSTAVDGAIRFVHFYNNLHGRPEKKVVISRAKAYHGSTYLSATMCGKERDKNWFDQASELVRFLPDVSPSRRPANMSIDNWLEAKVADLESEILATGPEHVAAFIAEPVLASGGVIVPPKGYHERCMEICRKYDVLYISDEVVTAFGRLGHWFASKDEFGIEPDIITCAKGLTSGYLPMGAYMISDRLFDQISGDRAQGAVLSNGFTYSGHPVCAAAALKNIEIMENESILEHVRTIAPHFQERLHDLADLPIVTDTRGLGLTGCVECSVDYGNVDELAGDKALGARIDEHCQELGLLVRPLVNMCVFSPPLTITVNQIDSMFDILAKGIRRTADDLACDRLSLS